MNAALIKVVADLALIAAQYAEAQQATQEAADLRAIAARATAITERILARELARLVK